jgi:hypothetical protein
MKVSFGRRVVIALIVVVGVAAVVVLLLRARGTEAPAVASVTKPAVPAQPVSASPAFKTAVPEPALAGSAAATQPDDYDEHPLADVMHRVLANDHQLNTFMYYYNRPLLDDADKDKYHQLLSDRAVFAGVEHDLLYPEETRADKAGNVKRLMKIDYLREALQWKDNPARSELIALVKDILLTDNYPPEMTMDMRLSLSGNKQELYELLLEIAPDEAAAVLRASKGTRLEKLLAYIANNVEAGKKLAASAESQVAPPRAE